MSQYKNEMQKNLLAAINKALNEINTGQSLRQYRANAHGEMARRVQRATPAELAPTPSSNEGRALLALINSGEVVPKVNIAKNTPTKPKRPKSNGNSTRKNR